MSVKIKLKRLGKIRAPYYRIVVADARAKRDGRAIEELGIYHPKENPSRIEVNSERVAYWLGVGAQPTDPVRAILKVTGDWQSFKGEPAPPPMLMAKEQASRADVYESHLAEAKAESADEAKARNARKKAAAAAKAEATEAPAAESTEAAPDAEAATETEAAPAAAADEASAADSAADAAADAEAPADAPADGDQA